MPKRTRRRKPNAANSLPNPNRKPAAKRRTRTAAAANAGAEAKAGAAEAATDAAAAAAAMAAAIAEVTAARDDSDAAPEFGAETKRNAVTLLSAPALELGARCARRLVAAACRAGRSGGGADSAAGSWCPVGVRLPYSETRVIARLCNPNRAPQHHWASGGPFPDCRDPTEELLHALDGECRACAQRPDWRTQSCAAAANDPRVIAALHCAVWSVMSAGVGPLPQPDCLPLGCSVFCFARPYFDGAAVARVVDALVAQLPALVRCGRVCVVTVLGYALMRANVERAMRLVTRVARTPTLRDAFSWRFVLLRPWSWDPDPPCGTALDFAVAALAHAFEQRVRLSSFDLRYQLPHFFTREHVSVAHCAEAVRAVLSCAHDDGDGVCLRGMSAATDEEKGRFVPEWWTGDRARAFALPPPRQVLSDVIKRVQSLLPRPPLPPAVGLACHETVAVVQAVVSDFDAAIARVRRYHSQLPAALAAATQTSASASRGLCRDVLPLIAAYILHGL